ncbi:MAG: Ig-like domain-containing protein [Thiothrix sp.]
MYNTDTTQPPALADGNGITLGGTGEPGATLTVKDGDGNTVCTATVAGDGNWSCTPASYPAAGSTLNLAQQDAQGTAIGSAAGVDVRLRMPLELVLSPVQAPLNASLASQSITFTLSNAAANPAVVLASPQITSVRASEFAVSANTCGVTLASGQSCTIRVDYTPDAGSPGVRSALLSIPDASGQTIASAILDSNEGAANASARRLPDVLTALRFQQGGQAVTSLQSGVATTVTWGQTGYQAGMESIAALFECNQATLDNGNCGNSYSTNTQNSGFLSADTTGDGLWSNDGVQSRLNSYSWTFTPTCQGDQLVLRFYQRSLQDKAAGYPSLSLLAPGGLLVGSFYYDQEGRRLSVPCTSTAIP